MNSTIPAALEALAASPAAKQALAERAAAELKRRRTLLSQLKEIEEGAPAKRYLDAVKKDEAAKAKARDALAALQAAELEAWDAETARVTASQNMHAGRAEIVAQLEAGASEAIGPFIVTMRAELTKTRQSLDSREIVIRGGITGKVSFKIESNAEAVAARVLAINSAIRAAEDLRLEADQSVVPAKLAALRSTIPVLLTVTNGGKDAA